MKPEYFTKVTLCGQLGEETASSSYLPDMPLCSGDGQFHNNEPTANRESLAKPGISDTVGAGLGSPSDKAHQAERRLSVSAFLLTPRCAGHGFIYGGPCGWQRKLRRYLIPVYQRLHGLSPSLVAMAAGSQPVDKEPTMADTTTPKQSTGTTTSTPFTPEGTPRTILGSIQSVRRGTLMLASDKPIALKPDELILWALGYGQWYLTLGAAVPDGKLRKLAEDEGIDFDGLIQLRDELVGVAHE